MTDTRGLLWLGLIGGGLMWALGARRGARADAGPAKPGPEEAAAAAEGAPTLSTHADVEAPLTRTRRPGQRLSGRVTQVANFLTVLPKPVPALAVELPAGASVTTAAVGSASHKSLVSSLTLLGGGSAAQSAPLRHGAAGTPLGLGAFGMPVFSGPQVPAIRAGALGPAFALRPAPAGFPGASVG